MHPNMHLLRGPHGIITVEVEPVVEFQAYADSCLVHDIDST
jgi:hypothetical protein